MAIGIYGNEQYADNATLTNVVITGTARAAYMFTATANKTITTVMVAHRERTGFNGLGTYTVSIRTGTSAGPTGANLCNVNFAIPSGGNPALVRWVTCDVTDLAVSGGNTYCVVIAPTTSSSPATAVFQTYMASSAQPLTGYTFFTSANSGATWTSGNFLTPPFIVNFDDGSTVGQVYSSVVTGGINNNNNVGEYFILSGYATLTAGGIEVYVKKNPTTNPTGSLIMVLERTGVDIPNTTGTLTPGSATTAGGWQVIPFTSNITLTANEGFRLRFYSPGTDGAEGWQIYRLLDNSSGTVKDALTWGTQVSYACTSANSGGAWSRVSGADISFKLTSAMDAGNAYSAVVTDPLNVTAAFNRTYVINRISTEGITDTDAFGRSYVVTRNSDEAVNATATFGKLTDASKAPTENPTAAETIAKHLQRTFRG